MNNELTPFERIRRVNPAGNEFWSSRDFARVLGYTDYRNFEAVIAKARTACFNSGQRVEDHFVDITDMVDIGSGAQRPIDKANRAHREVGAKVRQTIKELGGTMPEDLPVAPSVKQVEAKARKALPGKKKPLS